MLRLYFQKIFEVTKEFYLMLKSFDDKGVPLPKKKLEVIEKDELSKSNSYFKFTEMTTFSQILMDKNIEKIISYLEEKDLMEMFQLKPKMCVNLKALCIFMMLRHEGSDLNLDVDEAVKTFANWFSSMFSIRRKEEKNAQIDRDIHQKRIQAVFYLIFGSIRWDIDLFFKGSQALSALKINTKLLFVLKLLKTLSYFQKIDPKLRIKFLRKKGEINKKILNALLITVAIFLEKIDNQKEGKKDSDPKQSFDKKFQEVLKHESILDWTEEQSIFINKLFNLFHFSYFLLVLQLEHFFPKKEGDEEEEVMLPQKVLPGGEEEKKEGEEKEEIVEEKELSNLELLKMLKSEITSLGLKSIILKKNKSPNLFLILFLFGLGDFELASFILPHQMKKAKTRTSYKKEKKAITEEGKEGGVEEREGFGEDGEEEEKVVQIKFLASLSALYAFMKMKKRDFEIAMQSEETSEENAIYKANVKVIVEGTSNIFTKLIAKQLKSLHTEGGSATAQNIQKRILKALENEDLFAQLLILLHSIRFGVLTKGYMLPSIIKIVEALGKSLDQELFNKFEEVITALLGVRNLSDLSGNVEAVEDKINVRISRILIGLLNIFFPELNRLFPLIKKLVNLAFTIGETIETRNKEELLNSLQTLGEEIGSLFGVNPYAIQGIMGIMHGDYDALVRMATPIMNIDPEVKYSLN